MSEKRWGRKNSRSKGASGTTRSPKKGGDPSVNTKPIGPHPTNGIKGEAKENEGAQGPPSGWRQTLDDGEVCGKGPAVGKMKVKTQGVD